MSLSTGPADPRLDPRVDWCSVSGWILASLGQGWRLDQMIPLAGATSSTLTAVSASHGEAQAELVLRLYTQQRWLVEVPDVPAREAANLVLAGQVAGLPVPEVVNVDAWGGACAMSNGEPLPALLMTRLPGQVVLPHHPDQAWLHALAEVIAPLHAHAGATLWRRYAPFVEVATLRPPRWSTRQDLWEGVIERVQGPWPSYRPCLIHRDYHPCNVLWQGGRVSGIVDWPLACRGPAQIDAAWCRKNLVGLYGHQAALAYTAAWQEVEGAGEPYEPFWDLSVLVEQLDGPVKPYGPWCDLGGLRVSTPQMVRRLDDWIVCLCALI